VLKQNAQAVGNYLSQTFGAIARLHYNDPHDAKQTRDTQAKWWVYVYGSEEDAERDTDPVMIIYSATIEADTFAPRS